MSKSAHSSVLPQIFKLISPKAHLGELRSELAGRRKGRALDVSPSLEPSSDLFSCREVRKRERERAHRVKSSILTVVLSTTTNLLSPLIFLVVVSSKVTFLSSFVEEFQSDGDVQGRRWSSGSRALFDESFVLIFVFLRDRGKRVGRGVLKRRKK